MPRLPSARGHCIRPNAPFKSPFSLSPFLSFSHVQGFFYYFCMFFFKLFLMNTNWCTATGALSQHEGELTTSLSLSLTLSSNIIAVDIYDTLRCSFSLRWPLSTLVLCHVPPRFPRVTPPPSTLSPLSQRHADADVPTTRET